MTRNVYCDWYRHRCCECGQFCQWDSDYCIPFGGPEDIEPPDPRHYCKRCSADLEEYYVERKWIPSAWIPSDWQRRTAKRLGLVRVSIENSAWGVWCHPDKIPAGWQEVEPIEE